MSEQRYLTAIELLRSQLNDLLQANQARRLEIALAALKRAAADHTEFIDEVIELLQYDYPIVYYELQKIVANLPTPDEPPAPPPVPLMEAAIEELPPALPPPPPPAPKIGRGTIMVCPLPECDYEHELRNIGELPLFCKNHAKKLIAEVES